MKGLSIAIGAYSAMLWRTIAGIAIAAPVWAITGARRPPRAALRLHMLRGAVTAVMAVSFFWGLARTPVAQAIALTFIAPLIALYLARVVLGETIGRGALIGTGIAMAGVLAIAAAALGEGVAGWHGIAAILFSAVCYAWNLILQRQQAQAASPGEIAFFQSLTMAGFLGLATPFAGVASPEGHILPILLSAALATVSLHLLSWAYARAPASYLVPVEYTAFLWAATFGWIVYAEPLSPATIAGAVLIVAGCLVAARRPAGPTRTPAPNAEAQL